jgi:hypothetical protein
LESDFIEYRVESVRCRGGEKSLPPTPSQKKGSKERKGRPKQGNRRNEQELVSSGVECKDRKDFKDNKVIKDEATNSPTKKE